MSDINSEKIPNNVNLGSDLKLQRALEQWQPNFIDWWKTMGPEGFQQSLVYLRTAGGNDALAWVDQQGRSVTESQFAILKAAECVPHTPALPRQENHHELVRCGVELIADEERATGGQLGPRAGARFRVRASRCAADPGAPDPVWARAAALAPAHPVSRSVGASRSVATNTNPPDASMRRSRRRAGFQPEPRSCACTPT